MGAHPPHRSGEGVVLPHHLQGLFVAAFPDQGHVPLGARLRGTGGLAGRGPAFRHEEGVGNGLRIGTVDRLPFIQSGVEFVWQADRADRHAIGAAGALRRVHVPGTAAHPRRKPAGNAFEREEFGIGENLDVQMTPRLHELRRDDAHGAIVRGKRLVQLGHATADGGRRSPGGTPLSRRLPGRARPGFPRSLPR